MFCLNVNYYGVCAWSQDPDFSPDSQKGLGDELGSLLKERRDSSVEI